MSFAMFWFGGISIGIVVAFLIGLAMERRAKK